MKTENPALSTLNRDLQYEIEQFLYWEAELLDRHRYHEWLDLLTEDLEYWMPIRSTRQQGDEAQEFTRPGQGAFFDDTKPHMEERVPERRLLLVTYLLGAGIVVYLLTVRTLAGALVFAVLFGFTSRGGNTLLNLILAEYFGRASFGTISGFVQPFSMAGLAVGPLVASIVFDLTGTYRGVFRGYAGLRVAGAGCSWLAKPPNAPTAPPAVARRRAHR